MKEQRLSFSQMWNLSFGFFGVQIAYALQSANISRIFATLGADPHQLSFFWILPPLMGMVVQPLIGRWSDATWCRWGRRLQFLCHCWNKRQGWPPSQTTGLQKWALQKVCCYYQSSALLKDIKIR